MTCSCLRVHHADVTVERILLAAILVIVLLILFGVGVNAT